MKLIKAQKKYYINQKGLIRFFVQIKFITKINKKKFILIVILFPHVV